MKRNFSIPESSEKKFKKDVNETNENLNFKAPSIIKNTKNDEKSMIEINNSTIVKACTGLDKKIKKNREIRTKFADEPTKFLDSECELFEELQSLHTITCSPGIFNLVIKSKLVENLLELVYHENNDISSLTLELIYEMIDPDTIFMLDALELITNYLIDKNIYSVCIDFVSRIDLSDELANDHVRIALTIIETVVEFKPILASHNISQTLIQWIFNVIDQENYNSYMLHAVEVLTVLLQICEENRKYIYDNEGLKSLIYIISPYRLKDPQINDEIEFEQNLFDCICTLLLYKPSIHEFIENQGMELMIIMLNSKYLSRFGALKVLSFVLGPNTNKDICHQFINEGGVNPVFQLLSSQNKSAKKIAMSSENIEEYTCSIIYSILQRATHDQHKEIIDYFLQQDYIILHRILDIFFKYNTSVNVINDKIKIRITELGKAGIEVDQDMKEIFYNNRLDAGLFTLQQITCIIFEIFSCKLTSLNSQIEEYFSHQNLSLNILTQIVDEYIQHLGQDDTYEDVSCEKERLSNFKNLINFQ